MLAHPNAGLSAVRVFLSSSWWMNEPLELPVCTLPEHLDLESVLHDFAINPDQPGLRCFAALHPLAAKEDLVLLAQDRHPRVRFAVTRNGTADDEVKALAALSD